MIPIVIGAVIFFGAVAGMKGAEATADALDKHRERQRVIARARELGLREDYMVAELYLPPEFSDQLDAICAGRPATKEVRFAVSSVCRSLQFGNEVANGRVEKRLLLFNRGEDPVQALRSAWAAFLDASSGSDEEVQKTSSAVVLAAQKLKGGLL